MDDFGTIGSETVFYHGTREESLEGIRARGLRWEEGRRLRNGGPMRAFLRKGVYLTRKIRTALDYGPHVFSARVVPGTRLLNLAADPDPRVLEGIRRKHGAEALRVRHWRALPFNKRWSPEETLALARHHFRRAIEGCEGGWFSNTKNKELLESLMACRSLATRFGYQGFGDPDGFIGMVVFDDTRLRTDGYVGYCPEYLMTGFGKIAEADLSKVLAEPEGRGQARMILDAGLEPYDSHLHYIRRNFPHLLESPAWVAENAREREEELREFREKVLKDARASRLSRRRLRME